VVVGAAGAELPFVDHTAPGLGPHAVLGREVIGQELVLGRLAAAVR
jgi:hypothetical protein